MKQFIFFLCLISPVFFSDNIRPFNKVMEESESLNKDNMIDMNLLSADLVSTDSLYMKYAVKNNSKKNYIFFHLEYLNILAADSEDSEYPMCNIYFIEKNKRIPPSTPIRLGGFVEAKEENKEYHYTIIPAGETKVFIKSVFVGSIDLSSDNITMMLKYLPPQKKYNVSFKNRFNKVKNTTPELENYEMYDRFIESNKVKITKSLVNNTQ